ncbi:MAG: hypothetical protein WDN06_21660 [Asticcacaulis sp.]
MNHTIRLIPPAEAATRRHALIGLLIDSVESGASVNFVRPMTRAKAEAWWDGALASHARGERRIFIAEADGCIDGMVPSCPRADGRTRPTAPMSPRCWSTAAPAARAWGAALLAAVEDEAPPHRPHPADARHRKG